MEIYKMSQNDSSMNGMGTTFTAAAVIGNKLYGLHVGDSRIYVYDKNGLKQLTKDHSFVMEMVRMGKLTIDEARVHPKRNMYKSCRDRGNDTCRYGYMHVGR